MKKPDKGSLSAMALTIVNTEVQRPYNGLIFLRIECSAPALSSSWLLVINVLEFR